MGSREIRLHRAGEAELGACGEGDETDGGAVDQAEGEDHRFGEQANRVGAGDHAGQQVARHARHLEPLAEGTGEEGRQQDEPEREGGAEGGLPELSLGNEALRSHEQAANGNEQQGLDHPAEPPSAVFASAAARPRRTSWTSTSETAAAPKMAVTIHGTVRPR